MPELRIIDQQLWDQALVRLHSIDATPHVQKLRASRFWEKRRAQHLSSGLALCAECGKPLAATGHDYLGCNNARNKGLCGNKRSIRHAVIENLVLDGLRHQLMAPELVAEFTSAYHKEVNRQRAGLAGDRHRQQQELTGIERRIASPVDSIADGLDSPAIRTQLSELELRKAALAAEVVKQAPTPVRLHPNLSELYRQKVADLHLALADPQIGPEALSLLRSLIFPFNAMSGEPYRGVNVLVLWSEAKRRGWSSRFWATYRQWRELDCQVQRGERAATVVYYKRQPIYAQDDKNGEEAVDYRFFSRALFVFNADQVIGWTERPVERSVRWYRRS